jgi:hypothetical protein
MTWRGRDLVGAAGVGNDGDRVEGVEDREVGEVTSHPLPLKRLRVVPRRIERFFHRQGRSTAERIESAGGSVTALDVTASGHKRLRIDVTIAAHDTDHAEQLVEAMRSVTGVVIGKVSDRTFLMHLGGKIEMSSKHPIRNRDDLAMIYTPGVARVCLAIAKNRDDARRLTIKRTASPSSPTAPPSSASAISAPKLRCR